jgi:hypothetical protein
MSGAKRLSCPCWWPTTGKPHPEIEGGLILRESPQT